MNHANRYRWLLATLLLTLACATLRQQQLVPPEVHVVNIAPMEATLFEQRLQVDLRVRNPNDFDIGLTGMDFQLDLNGSELARGLSSEAATIPRFGEAVVSVVVGTTVLDWVRQLRLLGDRREMKYDLSGRLHLKRFGRVPIERSGTFTPSRWLEKPAPAGS